MSGVPDQLSGASVRFTRMKVTLHTLISYGVVHRDLFMINNHVQRVMHSFPTWLTILCAFMIVGGHQAIVMHSLSTRGSMALCSSGCVQPAQDTTEE